MVCSLVVEDSPVGLTSNPHHSLRVVRHDGENICEFTISRLLTIDMIEPRCCMHSILPRISTSSMFEPDCHTC